MVNSDQAMNGTDAPIKTDIGDFLGKAIKLTLFVCVGIPTLIVISATVITLLLGVNPENSNTSLEKQRTTTENYNPEKTVITPQNRGTKTAAISAQLTIDQVQIVATNLYPIRLTVLNNGETKVSPQFDVFVYDDKNEEVCYGRPLSWMTQFGSLKPTEEKTGEIRILDCTLGKDGSYTLKVDLLDSDYKKLDSKTKEFTVKYWERFGINR